MRWHINDDALWNGQFEIVCGFLTVSISLFSRLELSSQHDTLLLALRSISSHLFVYIFFNEIKLKPFIALCVFVFGHPKFYLSHIRRKGILTNFCEH